MNSTERFPSLIKSISCFLVVLLHTSAPIITDQFKKISLIDLLIANAFNSISRVAVPLFFMLSGALLISKNEKWSLFIKKRLSRIAVPLFFWSFVFLLFSAFVQKSRSITIFAPLDILFGPVFYHLWFLYAILGAYFFILFIRLVDAKKSNSALIFFTCCWFAASSIFPAIKKFLGISLFYDLSFFTGYAGYLTLGHILYTVDTKKLPTFTLVIAYILLTAITISGAYITTSNHDVKISGDFLSPLAPNVVIASACFFILTKKASATVFFDSHSLDESITLISRCSFGIYLTHPLFLYILENGTLGLKISTSDGNPLLQVPLVALITFILSMCLTLILKRIPVLKNTV